MKRELMLKSLREDKVWEVLVIGGGATGLGTAVESTTRGYDTLLLEQADFAKGTSSRSTKLVHGGVRYLQQGDISLVLEALHERGLIRRNAPHLFKNLAFVIPNYEWWDGPFYTIGMKVYDMMAGRFGLGPSEGITREETIDAIPNIKQEGLRGGVIYYDGQFDDARLAISLAHTAYKNNATILNYIKVTGLLKSDDGLVEGVKAIDIESGEEFSLKSKSVVNATGVFVDDVLSMDKSNSKQTTKASQGVHLVLDKEFMDGDSAIMIPKTDDGRVLFAVPWHGKVIVGTTDTLVESVSLEPQALEEEIKFILKTAGEYLTRAPQRSDVKSVFAGLRPLPAGDEDEDTKEISRNHKIIVSLSGLITVTGGKWTTYRKMGQDIIDKVGLMLGEERETITRYMPLHGYVKNFDVEDHLHVYGSDRLALLQMIEDHPELGEPLDEAYPYLKAEIIWAVKEEMARKIEDVLARRIRMLFLDAKTSMKIAPQVAELMAKELNKDKDWIEKEVASFNKLAAGYLLDN
ncbi:MAG: glycerol-3-phosphate dehydrogenase/oxidase [Ekhidna sp.]